MSNPVILTGPATERRVAPGAVRNVSQTRLIFWVNPTNKGEQGSVEDATYVGAPHHHPHQIKPAIPAAVCEASRIKSCDTFISDQT